MERTRNDRVIKNILLSLLTLVVVFTWKSELRAEQQPRLAILPFFVERVENPARGAVICPLCKGIYQYGEVIPGAQNILTRLSYAKMEDLGRFKIIPLEKVEEVLSPSVKKHFEEKPISSAIGIGKELNADFIWVGYLFRFEERIGSSVGAEKPASVGFDVHFFRIRDGKLLWIGRFNETQRPLSENLLRLGAFLRRKASWLTAAELSSVGMDEILKRLPGLKELEEMP